MNDLGINIFDLTALDDINETLKSELRIASPKDDQVLSLFEIKNKLTIDEIIVGLFRKYALEKKRAYVTSRLTSLVKKDLIEKVPGEKGTYQLIDHQ